MATMIGRYLFGLGAAFSLAGCAPSGKLSAGDSQTYAGWYMVHAGQGSFQSCGKSLQLRVSESAELRSQARQFGLEDDTPVYVRLVGVETDNGDELQISRVKQFGSKTPVRNCGLTGVVIPEPAPNGN